MPRLRGRPPGFLLQTLICVLAFGVGVGLAEAAGAANVGTAFGIGQMTFMLACVALLLRF